MRVKEFSKRELSHFCMQVSMYLDSSVPLDEGFRNMAEEAVAEEDKKLYVKMSEDVELGELLYKVMDKTKIFPDYVVKMAKLGQTTGTLSKIMSGLSDYYDKEYILMTNVKNALTYPVIMLCMLLVVLCFLFLKVMPIFMSVYESLGANVSGALRQAISIGGWLSIVALIVSGIMIALAFTVYTSHKVGYSISFVDSLLDNFKSKNKVALTISKHRLTSVLHIGLNSGLAFDESLDLAKEIVKNHVVEDGIEKCRKELEDGKGYYKSLRSSGLFDGYAAQLISTGDKSGHLVQVMDSLSVMYQQEADTAIDAILSRLEPTIIAILAIAVGLVLLSVMIPLAGVLAAL